MYADEHSLAAYVPNGLGLLYSQGPPGTGKTTTVLAILAVLLASSSKDAWGDLS